MRFSLSGIRWGENPSRQQEFLGSAKEHTKETRSEAAPIGRDAVIAMQFGFLRPIAPVEILVCTKRRRALQLVILDVDFVGLEFRVVAKLAPGQWQKVGTQAEEAAEAQDRVRHLPAGLVDHQPLDVADLVAVRPAHRSTLDAIARDQLVWLDHD